MMRGAETVEHTREDGRDLLRGDLFCELLVARRGVV